jgi:predicted dehydrogenase
VQVELSLLGKSASRFYVECESGSLEGDIYEFKSLVQTRQSGRRERLQLHGEETFYWDFGKRLVANFVDVVRGTAQPLVSGSDTLDSLDLIDECYAAAQRFDMPWYTALESGNV